MITLWIIGAILAGAGIWLFGFDKSLGALDKAAYTVLWAFLVVAWILIIGGIYLW